MGYSLVYKISTEISTESTVHLCKLKAQAMAHTSELGHPSLALIPQWSWRK